MLAVTPAHHLSAGTQAFRSTVLTDREQRSLALDSALGKRVAWDRILRRFALVLPDDVWLTSLQGTVPLDSPTRGRARRDDPERAAVHADRADDLRATPTPRTASPGSSSGSR